MSVISPNETAKSWHANKREAAVQLYLSGVEGDASDLIDARVAGFPLTLNIIPVTDWIDPKDLAGAAAAIVQVDPDAPTSMKRFQNLAASVDTPLIAAAFDPPLALVRSLVRTGAHDVVPLPLSMEELEASLAPLQEEIARKQRLSDARNAKLVSVIKSSGGIGATALATQLAIRFAEREKAARREACLIDLDVQFGDVAFQLGLRPKLSLLDLIEAGNRLDGHLLRATTTEHPSGLKVIAAPPEMIPLEGLSSDDIIQIVEIATREFGTVFIDHPASWTNWSLSLVARSDVVLLVTELTVAGLNRAKRQLDLLDSQELGGLDVRVIANRFEKSLARTIRPADVHEVLGRDIAYTVANDFPLVRRSIDQGVPIDTIKRRSAVGKDLDVVEAGLTAAFGLEH